MNGSFSVARLLATACALSLLLAVPACRSNEEKLAATVERARAYAEQKQNKEALIEFKNALKLDPQNAQVNFEIAELLATEQKWGDALFYYREAYRLDPNFSEAALAEARLLGSSDAERADELIEAVLARDPSHVKAHILKSELALLRDDLQTALTSARTAVELEPENAKAQFQIGRIHFARIRNAQQRKAEVKAELFQDAIAATERAIALASDELKFEALFLKARVLGAWPERRAEAEPAFRELVTLALASDKKEIPAAAARAAAEFAVESHNRELLTWALEKLVEATPENLDAWDLLARIAESENQSGSAHFKQLLSQRPEDAAAHARYADFLFETGHAEEAVSHLEEQLEKVKEPAFLLFKLMQLQYQRGEKTTADKLVDRLAAEYPDTTPALLARAERALMEERPAETVEILQQFKGAADDRFAQLLLALAESRRGNVAAARTAVDRANELAGGPSVRNLHVLIQVQYAAADWLGLLETTQQLADANLPLTELEYAMRVQALYENNQPEQARQELERLLALPEPPVAAVLLYARQESGQNLERARKLLEAALVRSPASVEVVIGLAEFDLRAGDHAAALKRITAAISEHTEPVPPLLTARAKLFAERERWQEAEADALAAFRTNPADAQARTLIAQLFQRGANEALRNAVAEVDAAGKLDASGKALLARMYLHTQDFEHAETLLEQALKEREDLADVKNDLAYLLARRGADLSRALTLAQEAQSAFPESSAVTHTLGFVYLRKQLFQAALQQLERAVELAGPAASSQPEFHYHLGLTLKELGRNEEAAKALETALAAGVPFEESETAKTALANLRAAATQSNSP